jgi:aspartyl protease family protein
MTHYDRIKTMSKNTQSTSLNRIFIWIAWFLALGLMVFAFQDFLDNQKNPNQMPESRITTQGKSEVTLQRNRQGHYVSAGEINNVPVTFLLDTGATQVSIPEHIANNMGLQRYNSYRVQTANGTTTVYRTQIETLSIGDIELHNVDAHINPSMQSDEILLGMSALKRVEFRQRGNVLVLTEY